MGELHTRTFSCYWHSGRGCQGETQQPGAGQLRDIRASHRRGARALEAGDEEVIMQKQRKRGRSFKRQSSPLRSRKMTFECIEVCFQGSVRAFMEVSSFVAWVNSIPGPSLVIGIRGVGAKEGPDS